jgi:hypothetical protein
MELSMGRRLAPCSALGTERGRAIGAKGIYASPQDGAGTGPEGADCAGLRSRRQNKEVAASLGLDDVTVGKWRRRFVERRMEGLYDEPRSGAPRTIDDIRIEGCDREDPGELACRRHSLELAWHDEGQRTIGLKRSAHLACLRSSTPPHGDFQALDRPGFRGQGTGRRWPLRLTARACHRSLCGREVPDPGA